MRPRRPRRLRRPRFAPLATATGLLALLALSSCAAQPTYGPATAASLREHVVTVSSASAAGDWAGALAALDAMTAEVDEAQAEGRIDDQRTDSILDAMGLVRQELQMAIDEAADAAERQRLEEEQAKLQERLDQLEAERAEQEDGDKKGEKKDDEKKDDDDDGDD